MSFNTEAQGRPNEVGGLPADPFESKSVFKQANITSEALNYQMDPRSLVQNLEPSEDTLEFPDHEQQRQGLFSMHSKNSVVNIGCAPNYQSDSIPELPTTGRGDSLGVPFNSSQNYQSIFDIGNHEVEPPTPNFVMEGGSNRSIPVPPQGIQTASPYASTNPYSLYANFQLPSNSFQEIYPLLRNIVSRPPGLRIPNVPNSTSPLPYLGFSTSPNQYLIPNSLFEERINVASEDIFRTYGNTNTGKLELKDFQPAFCELCRRLSFPFPPPENIQSLLSSIESKGVPTLDLSGFTKVCKEFFGIQT